MQFNLANLLKYGSKLLILLLVVIHTKDLFAQADQAHIYLIGNAASTDHEWVDLLIKEINSHKEKSSIYFLGDITDEDGIRKKPKKQNKNRLKAFKRLEKDTDAELYFLAGDRDWDNSGHNGKRKVRNLEEFIEEDLKLKKSFIPSNACPGPYVIKESNNTHVVVINSQWFIHPHDKPVAPDVDCTIIYESDFWEELEDVLEEAAEKNKNILILAHHPIYSNGKHNGHGLGKWHLLPIAGSLYVSYRKNIGKPSDVAFPGYQNYIDKMRSTLRDHNGIIYTSGHEFYNAVLPHENNLHINTSISDHNGSFKIKNLSTFQNAHPAITRIEYLDNDDVECTFLSIKDNQLETKQVVLNKKIENISSIPETSLLNKKPINLDSTIWAIAGPEYKASSITKKWMGRNYRNEWIKEIKTHYLDLKNTHGGLTPYARGGGLQTNSLKFKGGDGQNYVFRSINKNPERALNELIKQTIYRKITKQMITTQHPYGGLVASKLLDHTDILHASPTIYVMPDDPSLGEFRKDFANVLGFLEIKPKTIKKKKGQTFAEADAIVSTHMMLRAMYQSHDHRMDLLAYAKARVFDMWIGDWDKHEDNWKWARYDKKKKHIYLPIPRDRDHVFSKWEGVIPRIADKVIANAENFGYTFDNLQQLNYKASFLDRRFGVELEENDWLIAADYIVQSMTDEVIQEALKTFPEELNEDRTIEIGNKLKSRRGLLKKAVEDYIKILYREINIVGSNQAELFEIKRLPAGDIEMEVFELSKKGKAKEQIYKRRIKRSLTDVIYIYALAGKDEINLSGEVDESIKIRIIPGGSKDKITDHSIVKGRSKLTQVYQNHFEKDEIEESKETVIKTPHFPAKYDYHGYQLNSLIPIPQIQYNQYNGLGFSLGIQQKIKGFNKPEFAHKRYLKLKYFTRIKALRLNAKYTYRHLLHDWDFSTELLTANQYDKYPYFFGLGSKMTIDEELDEEDYYRIDFDAFRYKFGFEKTFLRTSKLGYYLGYEYNDVSQIDDHPTLLEEAKYDNLFGRGHNHSLHLEGDLWLDFRDNAHAPHSGSLLHVNYQLIHSLTYNNIASRIDAGFSHYETLDIGKPITLIGRIGTLNTVGELPFYQKSILGNNTFLRGYERNRFIGNHAGYCNVEARIELYTWYNILAPVTVGVLSYWDRGSVWDQFNEVLNDKINWRNTIGFGLYAAPLNRDYTFSFSYSINDENNNLIDFNFGFNID